MSGGAGLFLLECGARGLVAVFAPAVVPREGRHLARTTVLVEGEGRGAAKATQNDILDDAFAGLTASILQQALVVQLRDLRDEGTRVQGVADHFSLRC